jgi:hypothetical protein
MRQLTGAATTAAPFHSISSAYFVLVVFAALNTGLHVRGQVQLH